MTCAVATLVVGLQLAQDWQAVWDPPGTVEPSHAVRVWRFFSYFTTQSALLVAVTSLTLARRPDRDGRLWRVARLDALAGITITGLVHWFLLHPLDHWHGWLWISDTVMHVVVPILAVLGWLAYGPRRRVTGRVVLLALVWPLVWLACTLVVGGLTGWYPYFFLDVRESGAGVVTVYAVAILVVLLLASCLFWLGDRWLPGRRPSTSPARRAAHPSPGVRPRT
ncbi:MAG: hypothetical protein JWP61_2949 [Friedmanniella sp.]|nr:hypothetical protein [Friedmanniella sp.]